MDGIKGMLIQAVELAVATYGMAGVSTRNITEMAKVSDANIYRFFSSRDELLYQAYAQSCGNLISMVIKNIDQLRDNHMGLHLKDCTRIIFTKIWRCLLDNPNMCKFHMYYYHSLSFEKYAMEFHEGQVKVLVEHLIWLFWNEDDAMRCINNIFSLIYDSAKLVVDGRMPDNDDTANCVFGDIYHLLICQSSRRSFLDSK